jgi:hypothetical protein
MAVLESGDEVPVSRAYAQRVMQEMKARGDPGEKERVVSHPL